jgi:hypothetical protein
MPRSLKAVRGNAITEFAVLALVMVPAMSIMTNMGKMSDTNQSTIAATRYVAWERTVAQPSQKTEATIATEVNNRFFRDSDVVIESHQGLLDESEFSNGFSLLANDKESIVVSMTNGSIPSGTGADILSEGISTIAGVMEGLHSGANWDLETNGFYTAAVGANVAASQLLSGSTDCSGEESNDTFTCISRRNVIFVDGWTSDSPSQTEARVKALVPGGALKPVGDFLSNFGALPVFKELKKMKGIFGDVREDVLPLDRYSAGGSNAQ